MINPSFQFYSDIYVLNDELLSLSLTQNCWHFDRLYTRSGLCCNQLSLVFQVKYFRLFSHFSDLTKFVFRYMSLKLGLLIRFCLLVATPFKKKLVFSKTIPKSTYYFDFFLTRIFLNGWRSNMNIFFLYHKWYLLFVHVNYFYLCI